MAAAASDAASSLETRRASSSSGDVARGHGGEPSRSRVPVAARARTSSALSAARRSSRSPIAAVAGP